MGTESEQSEDSPQPPPNITTHSEFVAAYDKLVLQAPDACIRCKRRDLLRNPTLKFLRAVEPCGKLEKVASEVLQQNTSNGSNWEPAKALEVCKNLEDLVLRLWDQPWRKEFHTIKLYSGYFRTTVMQCLTDADRLLEQAGYHMDISGHKMVLCSPPAHQAILTAASEIYLLGLECQIYREIMCLVQVEGYTVAHIGVCRFSIACSNEEAVAWIKDHCQPGKDSNNKKKGGLASVPEDPIYAEISDSPKPSPANSRKSLKSSLSSVENDSTSPSTAGLSNSNSVFNVLDLSEDDKASVKSPDPEPIYSVVKKTAKKDVRHHTKTTTTGSPKTFTRKDIKFPPITTANTSTNHQRHTPRKNRTPDPGYTVKSDLPDVDLVEDSSFVRVDVVQKSPVEHSDQGGQGQYGFDLHGLQALRGSPQAAPSNAAFKPATVDEHQLKSLQSVLDGTLHGEKSHQRSSSGSSPQNTDWGYVQDDLEKRFGQQHILGERGDILDPARQRLSSPGHNKGNNIPMATFKSSNVTFSTFRPSSGQSPKLSRAADNNNHALRSSSPYENVGSPGRSRAYEVKLPHTMPQRPTPAPLAAIPVKLPTAPNLDPTTSNALPQPAASSIQKKRKTFTENLESRQSFYDNLPREEADCSDTDDNVPGDNVLQLLQHTKEKIERNLLEPSDVSKGEGVNCLAPEILPPSYPSPCYYSVPSSEPVKSFENKPRQVVTAPLISKPAEALPPPPHMHMMGNHWQCEACTSFNLQGTEICDICGKSRLKGAEQAPLVSGGPQCPKCTLINEIGASMCEACDYSFDKGVPTYI